MNYSPKLKAAMKEIEKIYFKHNIGGVCVLADGDGMSEYRLFLDNPSWSGIRFFKDKPGVHIKAHMKSKPVETNMTTNMLVHSSECLAQMFLNLKQVIDTFEQHCKIERGEVIHTPHDPNMDPKND